MSANINPIDLEIIRHRLEAINIDAGEILVRVSGSQIASEAGDYNTALMTASGDVVACSKSIVVQSTSLNLIVSHLLEHYRDNPGIGPGDQFLTNDPYLGSLHQSDVSVLAPIFHGDRLIGWSGATVHEADVGGPSAAASITPRVRSSKSRFRSRRSVSSRLAASAPIWSGTIWPEAARPN
jgi:N-methylhydantoinase B